MKWRLAFFAAWCVLLAYPSTAVALSSNPGAPTGVLAIPGNARATVSFTPPANDGGSAIVLYTVTSTPGSITASGPAWPIVVSGLANNTTYTFTVKATNLAGGVSFASSASNAVTPIAAGTIAPAVATAESFAAALDDGGQVYAWGSDANGQLGQGRPLLQLSPTQITGLPANIKFISMGEQALAIDNDGQVWSWGDNCSGALGPRHGAVTTAPARVIGATRMIKVTAGNCASFALRDDGTVWTWNSTTNGVQQVAGLTGITDISSSGGNDFGSGHTLALKSDGTVWGFGDNGFYQISNTVPAVTNTPPTQITLPVGAAVTAIAAGQQQSFVLRADGSILFWGLLSFYVSTDVTVPTPVATLPGSGKAITISVSDHNLVAVRDDNSVWQWYDANTVPSPVTFLNAAANAVDGYSQNVVFSISTTGVLEGYGGNNNGQLGQGNTTPVSGAIAIPGFASGTRQVCVGKSSAAVLALKTDGAVWFWGENTAGQRGDGLAIGSSVPLAIPFPGSGATIKSIATGNRFAVALDTLGQVWGWGDNTYGQYAIDSVNRSTPTLIAGISNVKAISAAAAMSIAFAKNDGTAWISGNVPNMPTGGYVPRQVLASTYNITSVASSNNAVFFLSGTGVLYAAGSNLSGELGQGVSSATLAGSATPLVVNAFGGIPVAKIVAGESRIVAMTTNGRVYFWGQNGAIQGQNGAPTLVTLPTLLAGITDAVDIASNRDGVLVRRSSGSVYAWGVTGLSDAPSSPALTPFPIAFHEPVKAFAIGQNGSGYFVGNTGLLWGWGYNALSQIQGTVGDGTYVRRTRPVVILAHAGGGFIDLDNWYLDLQPGTSETIPAASIPTGHATSRLFGSSAGLGFDGSVKYTSMDLGKRVNNYVVALVPPSFFGLVKSAPGVSSMAKLAEKADKTGGFVLVQLTPAGWTDVNGQLIAYSQGVANAAGGASNILNGINAALIPGSRFCVGYGETADSMLTSQALKEVLAIEGATATASSVPCVISGVYVSGPPSSVQNTPVTFTASVVGIAPTGSVQFRDGTSPIGLPAPIAAANSAVSTASLATSALAVGTHAIGAAYLGDGTLLNPAIVSDAPKLHVVSAPAGAGVSISGPVSSELGSEVIFTTTVTGNQPTGTVQFKDGSATLGAAAPLVGGSATLRTSALTAGAHSITAVYGGDTATGGTNLGSTSNIVTHTVVSTLATSVSIAASANPANLGSSVTVTVTVTGTLPTGTVTLRDGGTGSSWTPATLASVNATTSTANIPISGLAAGVHVLTADYSGGVAPNVAVSSSALFLEIALPTNLPLTVAKAGIGSGTVTSSPAGISCGATCTANFLTATTVTLTAAPDAGYALTGWSGACTGTGACNVTMDAAKSVTATFGLPSYALSVITAGSGTGSVTSVPAGINCGATCSANYTSGTSVTLTAAASTGSTFAGWTGPGAGLCTTAATCNVTMDAAKSVTATFTLQIFALSVSTVGSGSITSAPAGINCGATCAANFNYGTSVTLTASPASGWLFSGWSGAGCTGTGTCVVTVTAAASVTATFAVQPINTFALTVSLTGAGTGTVTSVPSGINCGASCVQSFSSGTSVALAAASAVGSAFAGWSGACAGTGACNVTMDAAKSVTATFTLLTSIPRLGNISTRMEVLTGNDVLIGGFIIGGVTPKTVVVRARGPSLIPYGITNALANPTLDLYSGQNVIATNDDWGSATNAAAITSSGFAPDNALESAILTTLNPGAYTAIVSGVGGGTGVGIVEVFEVDHPEIPLANISTRGEVLTGNDVMIGGFVIQGDTPQTVVVRARGPSLIPYGITNALVDPVLQLFSGSTLVATNDDWGSAANAAAITASGFAPSDAKESAILITLNPGAYTAIVTGANGGTGVGIVEVFAQ